MCETKPGEGGKRRKKKKEEAVPSKGKQRWRTGEKYLKKGERVTKKAAVI